MIQIQALNSELTKFKDIPFNSWFIGTYNTESYNSADIMVYFKGATGIVRFETSAVGPTIYSIDDFQDDELFYIITKVHLRIEFTPPT